MATGILPLIARGNRPASRKTRIPVPKEERVDYRNKVAIVTGASSGIGWDTALALAGRGATVVAVARRAERLEALVAECRTHAPESIALPGDLGEKEFAQRVVDESAERFGGLDILVNNAGVSFHRQLYRIGVEEAERVIRVNFLSCLWTSFAAIPHMLCRGGGHIVNVSSFGSKVVPMHETIYVASKCAMNGFSEGLRNDLAGSNIHVSLVHPGPIETEIWSKLDEPSGYKGHRYPASLVAEGILEAIEKRRFETVVPRRNPKLMLARFLRLVAPALVWGGAARLDPVKPGAVEAARERARAGRPLGQD